MGAFKSIFERYASIIVFHVETSGLDAKRDQLIELAAKKVFLKDDQLMGRTLHCYVRLYDNHFIQPGASAVNHITSEMLEKNGVSLSSAMEAFEKLIGDSPCVIAAYNASFDVPFLLAGGEREKKRFAREKLNIIDGLTVFKDRYEYPHKFSDAIEAYHLEDYVNKNRNAAGDVEALTYVLMAMDAEKDDLCQYINLIGYNPKYPPLYKLKYVTYREQEYGRGEPLYIEQRVSIEEAPISFPKLSKVNLAQETKNAEDVFAGAGVMHLGKGYGKIVSINDTHVVIMLNKEKLSITMKEFYQKCIFDSTEVRDKFICQYSDAIKKAFEKKQSISHRYDYSDEPDCYEGESDTGPDEEGYEYYFQDDECLLY